MPVGPPPEPRRPPTRLLVAIGLTLGVLIASAWLLIAPTSITKAVRPTAQQVSLEPTSTSGDNPFMAPVGQDQQGVTPPPRTGGNFSGDTAGLYGEGGDKDSCDRQSLVSQLAADPVRQEAWAAALGLRGSDAPGYVATLTPVVLRADTAVTAYGYADRGYVAYPAVLQAGTSVFVNSYGEPKVKCFSGNPLTTAQRFEQVNYVGPSWSYFQPATITVVHRAPTVIVNYVTIDVHRGWRRDRPSRPPRYNDDNWPCKYDRGSRCGNWRDREWKSESDESKSKPKPDSDPVRNSDPQLDAAAEQARNQAEQVAKEAEDAQDKANAFEANARNADADATALEQLAKEKRQLADHDPANQALQQAANQAEADAHAARENAQTAAQQAEFAKKAANAIEANKAQADANAKQAADKAAGGKPKDSVPDNPALCGGVVGPGDDPRCASKSKKGSEGGSGSVPDNPAVCGGVVGPGDDPRCASKKGSEGGSEQAKQTGTGQTGTDQTGTGQAGTDQTASGQAGRAQKRDGQSGGPAGVEQPGGKSGGAQGGTGHHGGKSGGGTADSCSSVPKQASCAAPSGQGNQSGKKEKGDQHKSDEGNQSGKKENGDEHQSHEGKQKDNDDG